MVWAELVAPSNDNKPFENLSLAAKVQFVFPIWYWGVVFTPTIIVHVKCGWCDKVYAKVCRFFPLNDEKMIFRVQYMMIFKITFFVI